MKKFIGKKYYLPLMSAILLAASIIPYHLLITNFIFLIPLLFFIRSVSNWKDALRGGIWFAIPAYMMILYWMYALLFISFYAFVLFSAMVICFSIFGILSVLFIYLFYRRGRIPLLVLTPIVWVVCEDLMTYGPSKTTGVHISNSMAVFPQFIQFIDITGPYGITVWLVLVNVLLFEAIVSFRKKGRMAIFGVVALIIACAPALYSLQIWKGAKATSDLKISMVQPNIPLKKKLDPEYAPENMTTMLNIMKEAVKQKPDLLVWPETAFPFPVQHWIDKAEKPSIPEISALAQYSSTPLLIGAEYVRIKTKEDYDVYNAALLMDSRGNIPDYYGKIYLVPFTEGIPFKSLFGIKRLGKKGILAKFGGFTPGEKSTVFEIEKRKARSEQPLSGSEGQNKVRFGVVICYEGLYPELSRKLMRGGADFMICITNDSWFGDTWFPLWLARCLRMRAIENRVSIVRCANTGISSFYDPAGRMYQSTEPFTKAIVSGFISIKRGQTFYTQYGDLLVYISYPIFLIFALSCAFKPKKGKE